MPKFILFLDGNCNELIVANNGTECKAPSPYEKLSRSLSKEIDTIDKCLKACEQHVSIRGTHGCCEYDGDHKWCGFYHNGIVSEAGEPGFKAASCSMNDTEGMRL